MRRFIMKAALVLAFLGIGVGTYLYANAQPKAPAVKTRPAGLKIASLELLLPAGKLTEGDGAKVGNAPTLVIPCGTSFSCTATIPSQSLAGFDSANPGERPDSSSGFIVTADDRPLLSCVLESRFYSESPVSVQKQTTIVIVTRYGSEGRYAFLKEILPQDAYAIRMATTEEGIAVSVGPDSASLKEVKSIAVEWKPNLKVGLVGHHNITKDRTVAFKSVEIDSPAK